MDGDLEAPGAGIAPLFAWHKTGHRPGGECEVPHPASNVRVFGSRARGAADEQSDIDILIALERGRTLLDLVRLKRELEELTQRGVDVVTDNGLSPILRDEILAQAVAL